MSNQRLFQLAAAVNVFATVELILRHSDNTLGVASCAALAVFWSLRALERQ